MLDKELVVKLKKGFFNSTNCQWFRVLSAIFHIFLFTIEFTIEPESIPVGHVSLILSIVYFTVWASFSKKPPIEIQMGSMLVGAIGVISWLLTEPLPVSISDQIEWLNTELGKNPVSIVFNFIFYVPNLPNWFFSFCAVNTIWLLGLLYQAYVQKIPTLFSENQLHIIGSKIRNRIDNSKNKNLILPLIFLGFYTFNYISCREIWTVFTQAWQDLYFSVGIILFLWFTFEILKNVLNCLKRPS